ncbi:SafA/ExsA family spore coat assembly protein [Oceanobacillus sojae]|uniref:SafA/ExsA family spore coat assembly protein n=1 Tax=Oceanobacillus sojae TaxID=582851 RepID=UPI00098839F7|nr:SafA/ExsA family spore coat assembly protein [Oceanobacillus sojae]
MKIHIVQLGDTLWKLAEKYNASFEELKKVNSHLANPEKLMPGMKIKIPGSTKQVQKGTSKKEQMTPVSKKEKTSKKEQKTSPSKEEVKPAKKEQTKPVQKEEKKKTEHPYKQKSPTPIAVLKEDDQKEKKKEQFEAVMPKMPQIPSMPILKQPPKPKQKPVKKAEPPKQQKKEKTAPSVEQQPAGKEVPQQQQEAFEFEAYQQPAAIPCEPVPFCPPMMPIFFMPCPPMPHYNPYGVHPGMQQGFPMMPPMHSGGDCGCGENQNQSGPMQAVFNPAPMGFNEMQYEDVNQQFQGIMPYQPQQAVNQMNRQGPAPDIYTSANHVTASNQPADNNPVSSDNPSPMPTSASFMDNTRKYPGVTENRQYAYFNPAPLSNSPENSFYPKPPFFPEQPKDKHDSSS